MTSRGLMEAVEMLYVVEAQLETEVRPLKYP